MQEFVTPPADELKPFLGDRHAFRDGSIDNVTRYDRPVPPTEPPRDRRLPVLLLLLVFLFGVQIGTWTGQAADGGRSATMSPL